MYANDDSDTESTSKATTSGRSQGKLAPIQVKSTTESTTKPMPKARSVQLVTDNKNEQQKVVTQAEIQRPKIMESKSQENLTKNQQMAGTSASGQKPAPTSQQSSATKQPQKSLPEQKPTTAESGSSTPIRQKQKPTGQGLRRPSRDQDHLSIACHLFPRLSETNLNFHDIYWNVDDKTKKVFIRKRIVNVSKSFSFHSLQLQRRPTTGDQQQMPSTADESTQFKLNLFLVDLRPRAAEQIVSNVLELPIAIVQGRFGLFCQKSPAKPIFVRSNYKQAEVVLRVQLIQQSNQIIGHSDIPLLDAEQKSKLTSKTQTILIGDYKFCYDASDPPTRLTSQADSLPDILLCYENWIPMLATFRQLSAEVLAEREQRQQTTWITDPVMSSFPSVCELPRLVEIFLFVLNKKQKYDTTTFRTVFMQYVYPIIHTIPLDSDKFTNYCRLSIENNNDNPLRLLAEERSQPLNIFNYAVHLSGYHALD